MNIMDIFRVFKIKKENEELKTLFEKINATSAIEIQKNIVKLETEAISLGNNVNILKSQIETLNSTISQKRNEIIVLDEEILLESFSLYKPKFSFTSSAEYKEKLDFVREKQKALIKESKAATGNQNWTVNNSAAKGRKMVNDMIKLVLRSFNNECDYCVDNIKFNNIESFEKRIEKSFDALNKLGDLMSVRITDKYKSLKFDELHLAHEYQLKKQEEKEEQKRIREELREQQKLEQEIKEAREKINKEKKHNLLALKSFETKLKSLTDQNEIDDYKKKISDIESKLKELSKEETVIDYREQNAKAGYVYIISNIGAFGKDVYKIGMTRRLEPMDRVDELGDASVPFSFDVHGLIFSDNAPELEAKLHNHFYSSRINKLNNRKEFFKADIQEIEKVVKENYEKAIDIIKEAPAEQYRESLLLS